MKTAAKIKMFLAMVMGIMSSCDSGEGRRGWADHFS